MFPSDHDLWFDRELQQFKAATRDLFPPFMCCTRDKTPPPGSVARVPVGSSAQTPAAGRQSFNLPADGPAATRAAPGYSRYDLGPGAVNAQVSA